MKKISLIVLSFTLLSAFSCKQAKKENEQASDNTEEMVGDQSLFSIVEDSTKVHFTAYKTTAKKPVGGDFQKVNLTYDAGDSPKEIIDGLEFSIPVSSLFTNDSTGTRDPKILAGFFGFMTDTEFIKGKFSVIDYENCTASLTMNGVTTDLPMTYQVIGDKADFKGTIELKNWNALKALTSLNLVCEELHKGEDGISKTWEDVAVDASLLFKKK